MSAQVTDIAAFAVVYTNLTQSPEAKQFKGISQGSVPEQAPRRTQVGT